MQPGGCILGGIACLQLGYFGVRRFLGVGSFLLPVGVVAFQLGVGFVQLGADGITLGFGRLSGLLFAVHVRAVKREHTLHLLIGQAKGFELFGFHGCYLLCRVSDRRFKVVAVTVCAAVSALPQPGKRA